MDVGADLLIEVDRQLAEEDRNLRLFSVPPGSHQASQDVGLIKRMLYFPEEREGLAIVFKRLFLSLRGERIIVVSNELECGGLPISIPCFTRQGKSLVEVFTFLLRRS